MKRGAIKRLPGGVFRTWAWEKSAFLDLAVAFHATWQAAFDHLRAWGAHIITDESEVTA